MLNFRNDYSEGAHPAVLEALTETNLLKTPGYGSDSFCAAAADTICRLCGAPGAQVHFVAGGTQANKLVIGALLRPYEAVIAAATGHIAGHEAGAIEHNGHKILTLPAPDGKLTAQMVAQAVSQCGEEYTPLPRLVYLSNTTEVGTVYTRRELSAIRACCRELGLLLYCDGARLGSAITAPGSDLGFADYAALCDAFTIGGTKNGLLFGEAVVLTNPSLYPNFRRAMKQQGAILAKGRLLGVQFGAILKDGLYLELARHANRMALRLREGLVRLGYPLAYDSPSNQLFPVLTAAQSAALAEDCAFETIELLADGRLCVRFVTSWTTQEAEVDALLDRLEALR